jgi:hypothetical protein
MDRLLFASEGVLSEVADMYPASHEGQFHKLIFHRGFFLHVSGRGAVRSTSKGELSLWQGTSLQTSHPAGRSPHHGPAFGMRELQEGGTTL